MPQLIVLCNFYYYVSLHLLLIYNQHIKMYCLNLSNSFIIKQNMINSVDNFFLIFEILKNNLFQQLF